MGEYQSPPNAVALSSLPLPLRLVALNILWLFGLSIFIVAGAGLATFHGDEAMQITMSRDYATLFIERQPGALLVNPPYVIDSEAWLRLINGSVNRFAVGLSWHLSGFSVDDLPGLWQWPLSYDANVERGHRPPDDLLYAARLPSALLLATSAAVMFALGWQLGGVWLAYLSSGLYALHPVILLNGRRAMQEGAMLCFGLLAILLALLIVKRLTRRNFSRRDVLLWLGLAGVSALALASKHSAAVFVAAAFGWIVLEIATTAFRRGGFQPFPYRQTGFLLGAGVLTIALFIALSPALWNDPAARLGDLLRERQKLLESQVVAAGQATTFTERISSIVIQPFIAPPEHFEAAFWADALQPEISRYMASPLSGVQFGLVLGLPLTLLAGVGLVLLARRWPGLLAWGLLTVASLLVNPLPWQRYALPLLPLVALLAGAGIASIIQNRRQRSKSTLV